MGRGSLLAGKKALLVQHCGYIHIHEGSGGGGRYFFEHGVDIWVFLRGGAGFGAVCREVGEDFVVGENGGLGLENLH